MAGTRYQRVSATRHGKKARFHAIIIIIVIIGVLIRANILPMGMTVGTGPTTSSTPDLNDAGRVHDLVFAQMTVVGHQQVLQLGARPLYGHFRLSLSTRNVVQHLSTI